MKLLIIGIDGLSDRTYYDLDLPMKFIRDKLLPKSMYGTSKSFIQKNRQGKFDPHTGPNWSSIYTGVPPEVHGIDYGGWLFDHKGHGNLKVKSVWREISKRYKLGLIGMPITYPAFPCSWMMSGFPNSRVSPNSVYPPDLKMDKGFKTDYGDGKKGWKDNLRDTWDKGGAAKLFGIEDEKFHMAAKLHAVEPVDVLAFGTTVVDKVCHLFTLFSNQGFLTYRRVDILVKRLFEHYNPEQLIIVSDHGFRAIEGRHSPNGFYLWYDKEQEKSEIRTVSIIETTKMILTALDMDLDMIGKGSKEEEYEQEDKDFITQNMKELGYL